MVKSLGSSYTGLCPQQPVGLGSDGVFQNTSAQHRAVEPEQWLQRHPEAGSFWPSWPRPPVGLVQVQGYLHHTMVPGGGCFKAVGNPHLYYTRENHATPSVHTKVPTGVPRP